MELTDFIAAYGETLAWIIAFFMAIALARVAFALISLAKTLYKRIHS